MPATADASHTTGGPDRVPAGRAWITGAGQGIGRALALRLARAGWVVAISARTASDLAEVEQLAAGLAGRVVAFPLDTTDEPAVLATVAAIVAAVGDIDLAVLNAGITGQVTAASFDTGRIGRIVATNLMGTVHCLGAVLPRFMERRSGQIAVVGSLAGYCGLPTAAGYGPTKAALINLCECLKPELDTHGVRLRMINPGFVETPLARGYGIRMPFLIQADEAAETIFRGLTKRRFEIAFPWRLAALMRLLRTLPYALFFRVTRRWVPSPPAGG